MYFGRIYEFNDRTKRIFGSRKNYFKYLFAKDETLRNLQADLWKLGILQNCISNDYKIFVSRMVISYE